MPLNTSHLGRSAFVDRRTTAFPWALLLVSWAVMLALQHHLTPLWLQNLGSTSELADTARNGDTFHQTLTVLLGIIGAVLLRAHHKTIRFSGVVSKLGLAYLVWLSLSITWAEDPVLTLRRQLALVLTLLFCVGCITRIEASFLGVFVSSLAALNLSVALLMELWCKTLHPFESGYRFAGTLDPNIQGASLSLAVIFIGWRAWGVGGAARAKLAAAGIVILTFAVLTKSRTSLLALGAAMLASIMLMVVRKHRATLVRASPGLILVIGIVGALVVVAPLWAVQVEFTQIMNTMHADRDIGEVTELTGRTLIWERCIHYASERPLLGFGFGGFWSARRIAEIADDLNWTAAHGHSAYLDQALALGIPGAILYILVLFCGLAACAGRYLKDEDACGAWAAVIVFVMVQNTTESMVMLPTFPALVFNLIILTSALKRPSVYSNTPNIKTHDHITAGGSTGKPRVTLAPSTRRTCSAQ